MALADRYTNTAASGTCAVTIGSSGNNRGVWAVCTENNPTASNISTSAALDGVAGTEIFTVGGDPDNLQVSGWYWNESDLPSGSGTYNVVFNGTNGNGRQTSVIYYTGAKQSAPADVGSFALDFSAGTTDTLSADAGFTAVMASIFIYNSGNTVTVSGDETELVNGPQNNALHVHTYNETDGGMSHDFSAVETAGMISFAIEPAAGGSTPVLLFTSQLL